MLIKMRNMVKQKGQGIVEYALILAFVVGIGMMLNGSNLGGAVKGLFDDVAAVLGGSENKQLTYAEALSKWGKAEVQIPLRRSRLSGTVRATNPDKREPLTFET